MKIQVALASATFESIIGGLVNKIPPFDWEQSQYCGCLLIVTGCLFYERYNIDYSKDTILWMTPIHP